MNNIDKYKLYFITFLIDIFLIYILINLNFTFFGKIFISSLLIVHLVFYYALYFYKKKILDIIHYLIFIYPFFSLFCKSKYIHIVSLILLLIIQLLWIIENRCILNEPSDVFGFGDLVRIYTLILTLILSFRIGYNNIKHY